METKDKSFISGVVEGFYGRPWTKDQRITLFERLKEYGLNTYMYAPKDDVKHRKHWRDQYYDVEKTNLKTLIDNAEHCGINFVYALSPGLDIIFSCPRDVEFLKKKMKQVADLGCKSFALLFDDIEPELSLPDKQDFDSFGDAQVIITNQIYEDLGCPEVFLFCPTEYCTNRAKPCVEKSEYLTIVGEKLHPNIDVLWTGPKVVSKQILKSSIESVAKVLKRNPVIWDNIHANDYDDRRVFLGPYDGRPTDLYGHINGILTNPNCEYECNFIALHTLATWVDRCLKSKQRNKTAISMDIEAADLSLPSDAGTASEPMDITHDNEALKHTSESSLPQNDDVQCQDSIARVSSDQTSRDDSDTLNIKLSTCNNVFNSFEQSDNPYDRQVALKSAIIAWLEEFKKSKEIQSKIGSFSSTSLKMDVNETTNSLVSDESEIAPEKKIKKTCEVDSKTELENDESSVGNNDCCRHHSPGKAASPKKKAKRCDIQDSDLSLLADLFFLPYEHGAQAKRLISEFKWLKQNAPPVDGMANKSQSVIEWEKRAASYHEQCQAVSDLFLRVSQAPNKQLVQEICPYLWDVKEVVLMLNAFVKWLGSKDRKCKEGSNVIPEDPEPWMSRGGIAEELERLLPIQGGNDVFNHKPQSILSSAIYTIRPYLDSDKELLYSLCTQTCDGGNPFPAYPDFPGDKHVGAYLEHSKGLTFVVEDETGLCGYCVASSDAKTFYTQHKDWITKISHKYNRSNEKSEDCNDGVKIIEALNSHNVQLPENVYSKFAAQISIDLLPRARGTSIGKRLLACLFSVLKAQGVKSVHFLVSSSNVDGVQFYTGLGFSVIPLNDTLSKNTMILGRMI